MAKGGQSRRVRMPDTRWTTASVIVAFVVAVVVSGKVDSFVGTNAAFLPAMLSVAMCAQALTALMLMQKFLAGGSSRLVGAACAYLFGALMVLPHALAFPGLITENGPL